MDISLPSADDSASDETRQPLSSKQLRRREERKLRKLDTQHLLYAQQFSNFRLTAEQSQSQRQLLQLTSYDSISPPPSSRRPLLFKTHHNSPWARFRLVHCPCHGCTQKLDGPSWLAHYLDEHWPRLRVPLLEIPLPTPQHPMRASCNVAMLEQDVPMLLGAFAYQREGLNPLNCARNTFLPEAFRHYSQHGVLLLFASRTQHAPLWQRKGLGDVLAIWVSTPLQGLSISLRGLVQVNESSRYYAKIFKARTLQAEMQACRDFIKTDSNVILISLEDLRKQHQLSVQVHVLGEQKV